uniref:Uncharacterized protein n=1 Tax=Rhizophora mucronata TaxID=61149 RepID=A0A2P2NEC7_RHIMU
MHRLMGCREQQRNENKITKWKEQSPGGRVMPATGSYRPTTDPDPTRASTEADPFWLVTIDHSQQQW